LVLMLLMKQKLSKQNFATEQENDWFKSEFVELKKEMF
jgi:hypothetical protein